MRADIYLVTHGGIPSRTMAQKLIAAGEARVDGRLVEKPSEDIPEGEHELTLGVIDEMRYVSRGGLKLEAALDAFRVPVTGCIAADIGASAGGFTDCLLQRGATRVFCVDAGHGQMHPRIKSDPRVRSAEGCNARTLTSADLAAMAVGEDILHADGTPFDGHVDGCVMDVSFISQTCILPVLGSIVRSGGFLVTLIKPQFELGRGALSKGGVVRREADRRTAIDRVTESAAACGFLLCGIIPSPIEGGDGNREYIAYFVGG